MSLNSVNIMGNLTRDPEIKYISTGKAVCNLSIANNRVYTKNGEKVKETSYFDVEVWGVVGENCEKYLSKGSGIIVEGRLRQDRWEKDGKTQSRVRITANNIHFLPRKRDDASGQQAGSRTEEPRQAQAQAKPQAAIATEDIAWDE